MSLYKLSIMVSTIFMLFASVIMALPPNPDSSNSVLTTNFPLGAACTSSSQCTNGAVCFALNSEIITHSTCGGPFAPCNSANQCAGNTCNDGICQGLWSSTPIPIIPTTPLGTSCGSSSICENASTCSQPTFFPVMSNPACGGFGASCRDGTQCAFNTCVVGFCTSDKALTTTQATSTPIGTTSLGSPCSSSNWCVNGASCFVLLDGIVSHLVCGGFQSPCTVNNQCVSNLLRRIMCFRKARRPRYPRC